MTCYAIQPKDAPSPALLRMTALAELDRDSIAALETAIANATPTRARAEVVVEGREIAAPRLIAAGWAARVRLMNDGRRQFLSFLLPGDMIGMCHQPRPIAVSTVVALTDLLVATPPPSARGSELAHAYAISHALEEAYLLAQITRLGRLHAQERIADLLLELHERLTLNGMAVDGGFDAPLTQEMLGDALGLTSVHINRTLQLARRDGDLVWRDGRVTLTDPVALAHKVGRAPVRVSELQP